MPGFGFVVALVALIGAAILARKRVSENSNPRERNSKPPDNK